MSTRPPWNLVVLASLVAGCQDPPATDWGSAPTGGPSMDDAVVDERPVTLTDTPPPPIMGGTMTMIDGGSRLFVADPDRDLLHLVDVSTAVETDVIELEPGAWP